MLALKFTLIFLLFACLPKINDAIYDERYRPQFHYSPKNGWMNDPNGSIRINNIYHLFYQYKPGNGSFEGRVHWGHAQSRDLIHWENLPIALKPNESNDIFSGCTIIDDRNLTGLQSSKAPLILAFYTEQTRKTQQQNMAYSNDEGITWTNYVNNPIIKNPGIPDFRDPKVLLYQKQYYVILIAAGNIIMFYKSTDLINWELLSEFGENEGSHSGIWECPDFFPLRLNDKIYWILIVSINSGGPNEGSATHYFIGNFDGVKFKSLNSQVLWLDYGPDNYAGRSFFEAQNEEEVKFMGWMSNWNYAKEVPTYPWRGQMTFARHLSLKPAGNNLHLILSPITSLKNIYENKVSEIENLRIKSGRWKTLAKGYKMYDISLKIDLSKMKRNDEIHLCFTNHLEQHLYVTFQLKNNLFKIDRSNVKENLGSEFTDMATAPRMISNTTMILRLLLDVCSLELFADDGLTAMTSLFFPKYYLDRVKIKLNSKEKRNEIILKSVEINSLESIWKKGRNCLTNC